MRPAGRGKESDLLAICRVIMGVSGSPRNLPALRYAAALTHAHAATPTPVLAWIPTGSELADQRYRSPYLRREREQAAWERLHSAEDMALGGVPDDSAAEPLIVRGQPGPVLVHAASQTGDLLVIGTGRTRGEISRYRTGHASRPVLAVPPASLELEFRHGLHRRAFRRVPSSRT